MRAEERRRWAEVEVEVKAELTKSRSVGGGRKKGRMLGDYCKHSTIPSTHDETDEHVHREFPRRFITWFTLEPDSSRLQL